MRPRALSFLTRPSVKLTLEQEMIFVRPSTSSEPAEDPMLRGSVVLSLPKARKLARVVINLEGLADVYGGMDYQYESFSVLHKQLVLDLHGEEFEVGDHAFNFAFIIPSSTSVHQKSAYGRVRHFLKAHVHFAGSLIPSISSSAVAFFITANPSPAGDTPEPFETSIQHYTDEIGPLLLTITSPHLTVASLLHLQVAFLSPNANITIVSVCGFILQSFVVWYSPDKIARPPARRILLTKVDPSAQATPLVPTLSRPAGIYGSSSFTPSDPVREDPNPLQLVAREEEWRYSTLWRVPNDEIVRPTTLPDTDTRIRVTHRILVEVRFRLDGESEDRVITVSRGVTINSCCCLASSLLLPPYSPVATSPAPCITTPVRNQCLCNTSLAEMLDRDGQELERAGTIPPPTTGPARSFALEAGLREKSAPVHLAGMEGRV